MAADGNQLIFGTTFGYMEPMLKVAADNPNVKFEHATGYKTAANMRTYDSRTYEGAYMAGVVAGGMTKSNTLGVVGSIPIPEVIRNINSFTLGAQSVNPKIKTKVVWVGEWFNPGKETEAATALINGGADVLMQNTDSSAVLQTAEKMGKRAFGWDSDMTKYGPKAHLGSAVINWGPYYIKAANDVLNNTWKEEKSWWGVKEGAIDFVSMASDVPEPIQTKVNEVKAGLKDGSYQIWRGPIVDNTGKEVLAKDAVADDGFLGGINFYVKGVDGKPMDSKLVEFIKKLPKAELHIHIEGSLEPELIFALAKRNGIALPYDSVESLRQAYAFTDLQSFLDIYYAGASVLIHEQDFYEMGMAYLERAHQDNVVYAEIFFDPQTHTQRSVDMGAVINGLFRACQDAEQKWGVRSKLIMCFLRHLSEEDAFNTLAMAKDYLDKIIGVGLDSSEVGNPPEKFARVFARCRELGLQVVAHAGEEGPPAYIWQALELLRAKRIDHGVASIEDAKLMQELARSRIAL
ncbi:unnamed protein product, partial [Darwinula stevensoni]